VIILPEEYGVDYRGKRPSFPIATTRYGFVRVTADQRIAELREGGEDVGESVHSATSTIGT